MSNYRLCDICGQSFADDDNVVSIIIRDQKVNRPTLESTDPRYFVNIEAHVNCAIDVKNDIVDRGWKNHIKLFDSNPNLVPQYLKDKTSRLTSLKTIKE